ncbi:hypothetical protein COR50_21020 [Chitinophaga caeni]|uniref:DUF4421 domain-containing protein n=1 Tax=Chitinophaga caeni TaxID=2029983 RepID=A0A291QZT5_9BACT|nr:DUF4421 domain-containing protein [Chitinophaga caeni]ATL49458.1 hypothetical protein COR50_21020 [Chitinophaga caeni]
MRKYLTTVLLILICRQVSFGQVDISWLNPPLDSNYIEDHSKDLTVRLYGSRKYTHFDLVDHQQKEKVLYKPNSNFNVGFGFNYKFLGINFGFNLPFINNDDEKYGKTKYLDLQSHIYLRKIVIDFYGQYYKGYYLANPINTLENYQASGRFPQRPDMYNVDLGVSAHYIFNHQKFSYRAAYLQNEYQKKSAGSFLLGGDIFSYKMKGDSALVPRDIKNKDFFDYDDYHKTNVISLAVNGGYAYTYVIRSHFFVMASLSGAVGINHTTLYYLDTDRTNQETGWQLNTTLRIAAGYNSSKYFAGIHYVDMKTRSESPIDRTYQAFGTGNFRVSFVKRFVLKKKLF